jgi:hypothetical protein
MRRRLVRLAQWALQRGQRTVLWTQETAHLGNFLYDWMHAFRAQQRGEDVICLRTAKTEPWIPVFGPYAERLVVARDRVRRTDRREKGLFNEFGVTFSADDLHAFAEGFFDASGVTTPDQVPPHHRLGFDDVLVNVRRGDYYSVEENRRNYAFDINEYLAVALDEQVRVGGRIDRIHVVSDGIDWCQAHLGWLADRCARLTFETDGLPPRTHLAVLANAPRLVLANSTFSYWGGYLSEARHRRPELVVAPWFHIRADNGGAAWQLDPRWTIVRDIPGGWGLPTGA